MEEHKTIHLSEANTLSKFLTEEEIHNLVSLKITGFLGKEDFEGVLDDMCSMQGCCDDYDYDNWCPDEEKSPALKHLDMGSATYVDGDELPWFGYRTHLESCILPQGIKSTLEEMEDTGFENSETLKTIVLPEGLKGVGGFSWCPQLTDIHLPEGLEEIYFYAFTCCESIKSIHIPASVKSLDGSSFAGCGIAAYEVDSDNPYFSVIDGVIYSKDLSKLVAFPSAYPYKHFVVPASVKIIGYSAFMESNLESIDLPQGLITIEGQAFEDSRIRSITLPDTVTSIGALAFRWSSIGHIDLPKGISEIPEKMFQDTNLSTLEIPSNVRSIEYDAIAWIGGLKHLILHDGLEEIKGGCLGVYSSNLTDVVLPKTLKKVPYGVFSYSPHIKEFSVDSDNPYFSVVEGALCSKDGKVLYSVPNRYRRSYCVPEGVEMINSDVFWNFCNIKSLELPSSLKEIGFGILYGNDLKSVIVNATIPPKVSRRLDGAEIKNIALYVPKNTSAAYKNAVGWSDFKIEEQE